MSANKYIVFIGMGFELVGIVLTSVFVGQQLDAKFGLKGLAMVGLSMLGLAGWIYHIVVLAKRMEKTKDQ